MLKKWINPLHLSKGHMIMPVEIKSDPPDPMGGTPKFDIQKHLLRICDGDKTIIPVRRKGGEK